jgi:riboflavin kinase / FMN adenylyltransferase
MKIIHGLENLETGLKNTVVAIGVFDGVHRGHQEILHQTAREACSLGYQPIVLTFNIHPGELFAPAHAPTYLSSLAQRTELVEVYGGGIEVVVVVNFTHEFASLTPEEFVSSVLENQLGAKHVLVGADFRYGKERKGNVTTLLHSGAEKGFTVTVVPPILQDGMRISSTHIRNLVAEGDLPNAISLLGHPFNVQGRIVEGKKLGRELGFPTANLQPLQPKQQLPGNGIYAAYAHLDDGRRIRAAVNVGTNPTTDTDGLRKVEAYLMDGFFGDLYGQDLGIEFCTKIRDEAKFPNLDALITQMHNDVAAIDRMLSR